MSIADTRTCAVCGEEKIAGEFIQVKPAARGRTRYRTCRPCRGLKPLPPANHKWCARCGELKTWDAFYSNPNRKLKIKLSSRCKRCCLEEAHIHKGDPKRKAIERKSALKRFYGLTPEQRESLEAGQGGKCAICRCLPGGAFRGILFVDHDHASGQIRGLLCHKCNYALGGFRDDPGLLNAAIGYLQRPPATAILGIE